MDIDDFSKNNTSRLASSNQQLEVSALHLINTPPNRVHQQLPWPSRMLILMLLLLQTQSLLTTVVAAVTATLKPNQTPDGVQLCNCQCKSMCVMCHAFNPQICIQPSRPRTHTNQKYQQLQQQQRPASCA
jgi:hypothetical protein